MKRLFASMLLAIGLAACTPLLPATSSVQEPPGASIITAVPDAALARGTQALIVAENGYTVVAASVATAARSGVIPASAAPKLRELNRQVNVALDAGVKAQTGADKLMHAGFVRVLTDRLRAFLPGGN